ncbi:hypothetical protein SLEP1_g56926 [Rubroshorea leprosula]|uniref:Signal recognition particle subunit SRP68 n=1 Tax=Rubroshorea leprosula TaxID=152421 RepID=A0AAV5MMH5_9ROSI|nr:hypothetical protein SLEP1_g56926 [Rubroshorea leprosula]
MVLTENLCSAGKDGFEERERKLPGFFDRKVYDALDRGKFAMTAIPLAHITATTEMGSDDEKEATTEEHETRDEPGQESEKETIETSMTIKKTVNTLSPISDKVKEKHPTLSEWTRSMTQKGLKRTRSTLDECEDGRLDPLIEVLKRSGNLVNEQIQAQNTNCQLDRDQRKGHSESLVAAINKLTDALVRIADSLADQNEGKLKKRLMKQGVESYHQLYSEASATIAAEISVAETIAPSSANGIARHPVPHPASHTVTPFSDPSSVNILITFATVFDTPLLLPCPHRPLLPPATGAAARGLRGRGSGEYSNRPTSNNSNGGSVNYRRSVTEPATERGGMAVRGRKDDVLILRLLKSAQMQHGLEHGDYTRYRRYCTSRLRRLYKSLKFKHGRGKYTRRAITESAVTEVRFLHVVLYMAERAWSHAMEKRQLPDGPNASQHIYLIGRLRKAVKWANLFSHLCAIKGDSRTSLEAEVCLQFDDFFYLLYTFHL